MRFTLLILLLTSLHATTLKVKVSAYTSHKNQTDKSPFIAAWGLKLKSKHKKAVVAISRDLQKKYHLTNGSRIYLKTSNFKGYVIVRDKMHPRWRKKVDLYYYTDKKGAMKHGVRTGTITF